MSSHADYRVRCFYAKYDLFNRVDNADSSCGHKSFCRVLTGLQSQEMNDKNKISRKWLFACHGKSGSLRSLIVFFFLTTVLFSSSKSLRAGDPGYWKWALTPPMGWNSYDAFGWNVTEAEVMANASYMKAHLLSHCWNYVVVDFFWYRHDPNGASFAMDANGRLLPVTERFPSATDGAGFKILADKIHKMGFKFGIHIMRGIPRPAVKANLPIEGSTFHAADAADVNSISPWCNDMYGVNGNTRAGQDYYDSILRLYASWKVDFIKVDDLSYPYSASEIEAIRRAIDKCGHPIVFSTSPGETPISQAAHISTHANMWRVSTDLVDEWNSPTNESLNHAFDLAYAWEEFGGPGHWPDEDMIPIGKLGIRSFGQPRMSHLTHNEQVMLMSLWCLAPSPLMLGNNLPENDEWTLSLFTNDEVLAIDQDPLGQPARRISQKDGAEVWIRRLKDGSSAVGFFNRSDKDGILTLNWKDAGLIGSLKARDLWQHKDLGKFVDELSVPVPRHGAVLLRLR
jgi:alpha-galactosidase